MDNGTILGGEAFKRWLGPKSSSLMNGAHSVPLCLCLFLGEDTVPPAEGHCSRASSWKEKAALTNNQSCQSLDLRLAGHGGKTSDCFSQITQAQNVLLQHYKWIRIIYQSNLETSLSKKLGEVYNSNLSVFRLFFKFKINSKWLRLPLILFS